MLPRRPERLKCFDYLGEYSYFLTYCTDYRHEVFVQAVRVDAVRTHILRAASDERFAVAAYCFMPDHLHLLVTGEQPSSDCRRFIALSNTQRRAVHGGESGPGPNRRFGPALSVQRLGPVFRRGDSGFASLVAAAKAIQERVGVGVRVRLKPDTTGSWCTFRGSSRARAVALRITLTVSAKAIPAMAISPPRSKSRISPNGPRFTCGFRNSATVPTASRMRSSVG